MQFTRLLIAACFLGWLNVSAAVPICQSPNSDLDNDGWGWESNASCIVDADDSDKYSSTRDRKPVCRSTASDQNNDGWGWEDNRSCRVTSDSNNGNSGGGSKPPPDNNSGKPVCLTNSDPDGDGYGWENHQTCIVDGGNGGGSNGDNGGNRKADYRLSDITDLILITGQSNTLGANTTANESQDSPHERVFAFTSNGWEVAGLHQQWDQGSHPGDGRLSSFPDKVHNNFALHFGTRLAERDSQRVIGFILVSEPGEGIQHWDNGNAGMNRVKSKVVQAINEISHKSRVDGILWHQGESDWQLEGTSDPDVSQPAPKNYYPQKLTRLIQNLRSEPWARTDTPFICGETISAQGVNTHLMALNSDNDANTACVEGFGLPSRNDGAHMNADGLRTIGKRYADRYFEMTR